jgi:hypothetical protein
MTEGCHGGWPILNGYFTEQFYLPLESCASYKGFATGQCSKFKDCEPAVTVKESGYVGGYFGAPTELLMMKHLRRDGPLPVDLNVPFGFSFYKDGLLSEEKIKAQGELSDPKIVKSLT